MRVSKANANPGFEEATFCKFLPCWNFALKAYARPGLGPSGWRQSFPVAPRCEVTKPGQKRDRFSDQVRLLGGWISALISVIVMAVIPSGSQGDGRLRRLTDINAERRARHETTSREIERLVAEAHARLPRHAAKVVGACYVRFSTWMQDSAEDQVRTILNFAVDNGIFVPREHVHFDLRIRGCKNNRDGLNQLRNDLRAKKVKALLLFATNRLIRKVYRTLEFAEEVVNEHGIRAVFVKSDVDSANKDQWQMLLHFRAILDEFQVKVGAEHIRAALEGLFIEGYVFGTLTFGYVGEPVPGKLTKRRRPRCRIVIDPNEAKIVIRIFECVCARSTLLDGDRAKAERNPECHFATQIEPLGPRYRPGRRQSFFLALRNYEGLRDPQDSDVDPDPPILWADGFAVL
jgi:DNA invertase Pin-like site-specific DNA recombinase